MSELPAGMVKLTNVRVHYVTVHEPRAMKVKAGEKPQEPKYSLTVLMDKVKNADQILECRRAMTAVAKAEWGDKIPHMSPDRKALKDGGEFKGDKEGFGKEVMFVSASNKNKPHVVNRSRQPLAPESGLPYNGCICNVAIRFWAQKSTDYGNRINCSLEAVQYVEDGERLGGGGVDPDEVFDDLGGGSGGSSASDDDLL